MRKATKKVNKSPPKVAKSQKSIRKRPYGWEPITFYIYRNGDDVSPAVKLSVRRSDLENWEHLLLRAGEKLDQSGYVKRLYTMTGDWVRGPNGIKNGEYYVAVGGYEAFKHVMYGKLLERLPKEFIRETAPRPRRKPKAINQADKDPKEAPKKTVPKIKAPPISRKPRPVPVNTTTVTTTTTTAKTMAKTNPSKTNKKSIGSDKGKENKGTNKPSNISTTKKPHREVSFKPTTQPPPKTRLNNKGNQPKAVKIADSNKKNNGKSPPDSEDSAYVSDGEGWNKSRNTKRKSFEVLNGVPPPRHVYYASSAQKSRQKRVTLVNYDEDQGGVYKAKANTDDTSKAREVQELRDLPVELPIDEVEATEVGEEVNKYSDDEYSDYEEPDQQESDPPSEQQYSYPIEHAEVQMASSPLRTMSA